ncbi:MAG TPA: hypothetical protein VHL78_14040, partial [Actinomycetota bacterium]|nr:hypothetical protein [Actinomycetota bacterium]
TAAALGAGVTLAAAALVGQLLAVLQDLAQPADLPGADVARLGALFSYAFHHVAIRMDLSALPAAGDLPLAGAFDVSVSFSAALLLATAAVVWAFFLVGRAVAARAGGPWWVRPLHGVKPAVPYAVASFALSFAVRIAAPPPAAGDLAGADLVLRPSPWSALAWPFFLAAVGGAAGGLSAAAGDLSASERRRRLRAALAGGWRMTWSALALAFVGLLVLAAVQPDDTAAYFRLVSSGTAAQGAMIVVLTALLVPNLAAAVASVAMGGSVVLGLLGSSCTLLSYARFPRGVTGVPELGPELLQDPCGVLPLRFEAAPPGYLLFLLVPLVATVGGGWLAARRANVVVRRDAGLAGAAAGGVFAVLFSGVALLARFNTEVHGPLLALLGGASSSVGPSLGAALAVALVWGVLGGAAGGALHRPPGGDVGTGPAEGEP